MTEDKIIEEEFKKYWNKEWKNLEGEINQFTFKFWKKAWELAISKRNTEIIEIIRDFTNHYKYALSVVDVENLIKQIEGKNG